MAVKKEEVSTAPTVANALALYEKGKAGYPAIYFQTFEDIRSQREVSLAAKALDRDLYVWTFGSGLKRMTGKEEIIKGTETPPECLDVMRNLGKNEGGRGTKVVVVLTDFHHFLDDPLVQAKLKSLVPEFKVTKRMLIITAPVIKLPPEVEKSFALLEGVLPDKKQIEEILDGIIDGTGLSGADVPTSERRTSLVDAAIGLTTEEAENALSLSIVKPRIAKSSNIWDQTIVLNEKCQALKKTGLLEYIHVAPDGLKQVGGLDILKEWVRRRKNAFSQDARTFGLPPPKGILMVGPPGSGKSLSAKAISGELEMPLLRLDMGKMFGSLVGQSEANIRQAIMIAETISPCILWIN